MDAGWTVAASIALILALLTLICYPLGGWLAHCYTSTTHWRIERLLYRIMGVDPDGEQHWKRYLSAVMGFSVAGIVVLWVLIMVQHRLPLDAGRTGMHWDTALNTAVSFVTNTNWQSYVGETGTGYLVNMLGLTVQNFVSAATGMAVAVGVIRGLTRTQTDRLGNFWVDLVRSCVRILLPLSVVGALALMAGGVIQNFADPVQISTLAGGQQVLQGGPVASQEAIKLIGTNGGGIFNANSAHPFENPTALTNLIEILLVLCIPFALPRTYGLMVGDRRQARPFVGLMGVLWMVFAVLASWAELASSSAPGGAMEGKEQRFGIVSSMLFGNATTGTSTGAVNAMHDSMSALGGGALMFNMQLGEISPGGVGSGLYSVIVLAVISVFIAGLMVGRTPEFLGKSIGRREITYATAFILVMPAVVLVLTGVGLLLPTSGDALLASGPHGLSEMLYAYTSGGNNNGSAFAGLSADQPYLNLTLALAMFVGRFAPIALVLAMAGSLAGQRTRPVTAGTMPTHTVVFTVMLLGVAVIVAGLTFFPAQALGPLAEALR
jgi:K+-transporting ATPase ATPase A chain